MKKSLALVVCFLVLSFVMVFGVLQSYLTWKNLNELNFEKATVSSKRAIFLPKTLNLLTFKQIEPIKLWEFSIEEVPTIQQLVTNTQLYLEQSLSGEIENQMTTQKIIDDLEKINSKLNKIDIKALNPIKQFVNDSLVVAKKFLQTDQSYIVMLQNNDELRATGGFLGSYFILETKQGVLQPIKIQDIYAPDGQFTGLIEAPPGLNEYLSSGKGLRLPDANWWPNFADSAEQVLYFFENVENKKYQGVIALNLNTIEQLLEIIGEIYLPDYDTYVNKDNFTQIARADRNEFFPGSQEKANFLNHFFNLFKLELNQVLLKNPQAIIALWQKLLVTKDLQFYSRDSEIAEILQKRNIDGRIYNNQELYYFLVESNVGINKSNRLVDRQVTIQIGEKQEKIIINFQNNNQVPYVNYQRLYTNPETELKEVLLDGKKVNIIDQRIFTTKEGQKFKEIGFLTSVLAKSKSQIEINLTSSLPKESKKNIFIQKQAGLPITKYVLTYQEQNKNFELTSDQNLIFD